MTEHKKERDAHSGAETTGHEWDGIKELNIPAPRWWLWVFFACCVWAVGYWVVYPAWPTLSGEGERGGTRGNKGWTQYNQLAEEQAEILARRGVLTEETKIKSLQEIQGDEKLYQFAIAGGKSAFRENCAACHGTGAQGGFGYPNLADDDWIWGGELDDIYTTIQYGVRSPHENTRVSQMPAFGKDGMLQPQQISDVADYVLSLSSGEGGNPAGETVFKENCTACHGDNGKGMREVGAPNLTDAIWLYKGDKATIMEQVNNPRHGAMKNWNARLPDETIKQLTIYVHSLGGGE
jgi:cytochrome c oxidase cbb3-type subunit 3